MRVRPGEEIRLVKENLAFAVTLWKAASAGKVPPGPLLRPAPDHPQFNYQAGGLSHSEAELAAELSRGAANQMRAAFVLSALQCQRSMADAFPGEPIEEEWPELRAARSALYLIGLAVQHSILQPVWECPPPYRRPFHIRRMGFSLNATGLEGRDAQLGRLRRTGALPVSAGILRRQRRRGSGIRGRIPNSSQATPDTAHRVQRANWRPRSHDRRRWRRGTGESAARLSRRGPSTPPGAGRPAFRSACAAAVANHAAIQRSGWLGQQRRRTQGAKSPAEWARKLP